MREEEEDWVRENRERLTGEPRTSRHWTGFGHVSKWLAGLAGPRHFWALPPSWLEVTLPIQGPTLGFFSLTSISKLAFAKDSNRVTHRKVPGMNNKI